MSEARHHFNTCRLPVEYCPKCRRHLHDVRTQEEASEIVEPARARPGSAEAIASGCTCPVHDNNHGKWSPLPPDSYYVDADCPVHVSAEQRARIAEHAKRIHNAEPDG